jgi:GABA permease
MGIPYADHIMNAVVLTAVLSCLNSGLYTSSRMLFVLAARREAPLGLMKVSRSGVPRAAILFSSIVGFLCVIAAAVSPDTVFLFLLNSSGAVILFVYLLIALSQIVLRRRTSPEKLVVKMWLFPALSFVVVVAIVAVLVQMAFNPDTLIQLLLSLLSWGVLLVIFFATRSIRNREPAVPPAAAPSGDAKRVLVLANETVEGDELIEELRRIDAAGKAEYLICVPANPIDTGQAMHAGAVYVWDRTTQAAQERLDRTLDQLHSHQLEVRGEIGDYRPLRALATAVDEFHPDQLVICTHPQERSAWLRYDVVDRARETYPNLPLTHVVVEHAEVAV